MGNMHYCKFRNTLSDLRDCYDEISNPCEDEEEEIARLKMIKLCKRIAKEMEE